MECYHLQELGPGGTSVRLTDSAVPVSAGGYLWQPAPITRSSIVTSPDVESTTLTVPTQAGGFGIDTLGVDLRRLVHVQVYRCESVILGDPVSADLVSLTRGRVASSSYESGALRVEVAGVSSQLDRPVATSTYTRSCRWALYSPGCGVVRNPSTGVVAARLSDTEITSAIFANPPDPDYFLGGTVTILGRVYPIVEILTSAVGVRILGRLPGTVISGTPISADPGCDKSPQTCQNRFANLDNYGGFPTIPPTQRGYK